MATIDSTNIESNHGIDGETEEVLLSLPSSRHLIELAIQLIEHFLRERELEVPKLSLVLTELLRNAITHGNSDDVAKRVQILARIIGRRVVRIAVKDQGNGFEWRVIDYGIPENLSHPSRRGLVLVAYFANSIEFNQQGNCVTVQMDCERRPYSITEETCQNGRHSSSAQTPGVAPPQRPAASASYLSEKD